MSNPDRPSFSLGAERVINPEKERLWQAKLKEVGERKDFFELPIDSQIKEAVAILNLYQIPTTASCEGHVDHGDAAPWIRIAALGEPDERYINEKEVFQKVADQYGISYEDVKRSVNDDAYEQAISIACHNAETPAYKKWREANQVLAKKLIALAAEFYENREVVPNERIVLDEDAGGTITLHNGGDDSEIDTAELSDEQRDALRLRLQRHQAEIQAFVEFLLQKYLQSA